MGISPQQFEQLQTRVRSNRKRPEPLVASGTTPVRRHEVIMGIDPSLRGTGWGVIRAGRGGPEALGHDTLQCPSGWSRTQCLVRIAGGLREAIRQFSPTACAIEGLFYAQNLQTALILGEARGVCLLAVAEAGLEVVEIAPRKVKQAIVGFGGAQKLAVGQMVQRLLRLPEVPADDASDALALALTFASERRSPLSAPGRRL